MTRASRQCGQRVPPEPPELLDELELAPNENPELEEAEEDEDDEAEAPKEKPLPPFELELPPRLKLKLMATLVCPRSVLRDDCAKTQLGPRTDQGKHEVAVRGGQEKGMIILGRVRGHNGHFAQAQDQGNMVTKSDKRELRSIDMNVMRVYSVNTSSESESWQFTRVSQSPSLIVGAELGLKY